MPSQRAYCETLVRILALRGSELTIAEEPSTVSHGFDKLPRTPKVNMEATVQMAHRIVTPYDMRTFVLSRVNRVLKRLMDALVRPTDKT